MSLAEDGFRPARSAVVQYVEALTTALISHPLSDLEASRLVSSILEILRCASMTPSRFRESIGRTEAELISIGVNAEAVLAVADRLTTVGNQVRGPEDVPLGESLTK
jgi:hypothetical protein